MMRTFNGALRNARIVVWSIDRIGDERKHSYNYKPYMGNDQTTAVCSGYAVTQDNQKLVYASLISIRFSLDSIRATLIRGKSVSINGAPQTFYTVTPFEKYFFKSIPLPRVDHTNAAVLCREAYQWEPGDMTTYALTFAGQQLDIKEVFFKRLSDALDIPLLPGWTEELWKAGAENNMMRKLHTWGDCTAAIEISLNAESWAKIVDDLRKDHKITID